MIVIELNSLRNGLPTLTSAWGSFLSEAGQYCLTRAAHQSGTILKLINDDKIIQIIWDNQLDIRSEYSYGDDEEATEYGAICISILLAIKLTEFNTVIRTCKGSGFDYWLGNYNESNDLPFQQCTRLEVSGIKEGTENKIRIRTNEKIKRFNSIKQNNLPAIISIIEFSKPIANFFIYYE